MAFFANTKAFSSENKSQIEDELLQSDYLKNNSQKSLSEERNPITDELLNPNMYKDVPFRLGVYANKYSNEAITDSLLEDSNFIENSKKTFLPSMDTPDEYFIEKNIDLTKVRIIKSKNKYDFTKKLVPIEIKIAQRLKSTRGIIEGSTIPFVAQHDFEINGKKYSSGTTILGRVETISDSDKMGVPESLKISNFYIPDEKEIDLSGTISKIGANRSIWVYPLYQAGNILLYVAGFAVVPIHGGRAKLSTSESFTVFYEAQ
ncbi:hypothetical protein J6G99_02990 [bacterium]|nr:hypothetical protein [bacterium]